MDIREVLIKTADGEVPFSAIVDAFYEQLDVPISAFAQRLEAIERQVKQLPDDIKRHCERHGFVTFKGTWTDGREYPRGAAVVKDGTLWFAVDDAPAGAVPGKGGEWRLAVKTTSRQKDAP